MKNTMKEMQITASLGAYRTEFWNAMKGGRDVSDIVKNGYFTNMAGYLLPTDSETAFRKEVEKNGVIRPLAESVRSYDGGDESARHEPGRLRRLP